MVLTLAGCASITRGTTQQITISSNPAGAQCTVDQNGTRIADIPSTPQIITVSKSKHDLNLTCNKDGYQTAIHQIPSDVEAMTAGNLIFGGVVGLAIDAGSGAINKYDANVTVTLVPVTN
ncbi:translation initiation factor 2 [Coralliovum pocilloporae]|uniref:translation initiation factor 2 n=1 Tax=Coralliovum pocilloporae TaxID=3066369 RepID=UPI003307A91F